MFSNATMAILGGVALAKSNWPCQSMMPAQVSLLFLTIIVVMGLMLCELIFGQRGAGRSQAVGAWPGLE